MRQTPTPLIFKRRLVNRTDNRNAMPICGMKFINHNSQVFVTAVKNVLSANNNWKFLNHVISNERDIRVRFVKLKKTVFKTGYKPKIRKPMMNGATKR